MGVAKGQDSRAGEIFSLASEQLRIVMPSICVMEAWSAFEAERRRRMKFVDDLRSPINESSRDLTSDHAKSLNYHLQNASLDSIKLLKDVEIRLRDILRRLAGEQRLGRVELIPLTHFVLNQSLLHAHIEEPTDNLILTTILHHAKRNRNVPKILLTSNSNDFDTPDIRELLNEVGFVKYLTRSEHFLGWFSAQNTP